MSSRTLSACIVSNLPTDLSWVLIIFSRVENSATQLDCESQGPCAVCCCHSSVSAQWHSVFPASCPVLCPSLRGTGLGRSEGRLASQNRKQAQPAHLLSPLLRCCLTSPTTPQALCGTSQVTRWGESPQDRVPREHYAQVFCPLTEGEWADRWGWAG